MPTSTTDAIELQTGADPSATVIVLHGLGADGSDFVPFCEELDLSAVGPVRFIFPHAPVRPVTVNGGYPMRAWYDIRVSDLGRQEDETGVREARATIEAIIGRENARGISSNRIVLAGFSQGAAMTLFTGLCHGEALAGLAALSGYLPLATQVKAERSPAGQNVPVFMAHGTYDDVVHLDRGLAARDALQALGYRVQWRDYPMPHSVCAQEVADLNQWLLEVLA